jgi:hypothetical protein
MKTNPQRLRLDRRLTVAHSERLLDEGMAHVAGTGPAGARCRSWEGDGQGRAINRLCRKFGAMTGVAKTKLVPGSARACRHYEKR